jgi:hypothetical protein
VFLLGGGGVLTLLALHKKYLCDYPVYVIDTLISWRLVTSWVSLKSWSQSEWGVGVVYKARQQGLDWTVAVRVLQPSVALNTDFLACFGTRRFWFVCRWIYNLAGRGLVFRYDDIPKINAKERTVGDGGCCLGRGVQED